MRLMPTAEKLGSSDFRLKSPHTNGPVGTRWIVASDSSAVERVADLVAASNDDYLISLCENSLRTRGWTNHNSIANVLETGRLDDGEYFQILEMSPLAQPMLGGAHHVSESDLLRVALSLHAALLHMHKKELVHGALAPTCIYKDADGVKLGELWWAHNADGQALYGQLARMFPAYLPDFAIPFASPEVLLGQSPKRPSDLYSFGAVLFYLLTGKPPREFSRPGSDQASRRELARAGIEPLATLRADVSEGTRRLILKLLEPDPVERLDIFVAGSLLREFSGLPEPESF